MTKNEAPTFQKVALYLLTFAGRHHYGCFASVKAFAAMAAGAASLVPRVRNGEMEGERAFCGKFYLGSFFASIRLRRAGVISRGTKWSGERSGADFETDDLGDLKLCARNGGALLDVIGMPHRGMRFMEKVAKKISGNRSALQFPEDVFVRNGVRMRSKPAPLAGQREPANGAAPELGVRLS